MTNQTLPKFVAWVRKNTSRCGDFLDIWNIPPPLTQSANYLEKQEEGKYLFYIVEIHTNVRKSQDGIPIIYKRSDIAGSSCMDGEEVISIADYNILYARFMVSDGYWFRTY